MSSIHHNLRVGVRALIKQPTFTVAAVLTLALGIGATTAMFSIVYGVLLRPLPFGEPDRLVRVWTHWKHSDGRGAVSAANARDWRAQNHVFEDVAMVKNNQSFNFTVNGEPERLLGVRAWAGLFPILRAKPLIGRTFTAEDDRPGAPGTIILSYRLWQTEFGGDPGVIGRQLTAKADFDDATFTVIGVMSREFHFPKSNSLFWITTRFSEREYQASERANNWLEAVGRLKPGITARQASFSRRPSSTRTRLALGDSCTPAPASSSRSAFSRMTTRKP